MNLSVLNVDILLYLIKFLSMESRFNVLFAGVLPGLENIRSDRSKPGVRRTGVKDCRIDFGPSLDSPGHIEIRSLEVTDNKKDSSKLFNNVQHLMENGFLKNVRRLNLFKLWRRTSLIDLNGTMNHLEELSIDRAVKTAEDLTRVITSCPKLTRLSIKLSLDPLVYGSLRTNKLRSGFQRLKYLKLSASTLPTFGIILPFCEECTELHLTCTEPGIHLEFDVLVSAAQLKVHTLSLSGFSHWLPQILPCYANIRELHVELDKQPDSIRAISQLTNLKRLIITVPEMNHLKEIIRECPQLEILETTISYTYDFIDLYEPGTCIQELKIICEARVPIEKVLPVFERWHQLRRLCLKIRAEKEPLAPLPVHRTIDFIQKMEHLTHLHLADEFVWQDALSILGKVNEVIAPNRPGFVLDLF